MRSGFAGFIKVIAKISVSSARSNPLMRFETLVYRHERRIRKG